MNFIGIEYFCEETGCYVTQPYIFKGEDRQKALELVYSNIRSKGRLIDLHLYEEHIQD